MAARTARLAAGPMLARLAPELPSGAFVYEPKWDGFRCLAAVAPGAVELHSRHGRALTRYFPELVAALGALGREAALDGEIVVVGPSGFDFAALLVRVHPSAARVARLAREAPASFIAFDLLSEAGEDLKARPYRERRRWLEALLAGAPPPVVLTPATRTSRSRAAGSSSPRATASTGWWPRRTTSSTSPASAP